MGIIPSTYFSLLIPFFLKGFIGNFPVSLNFFRIILAVQSFIDNFFAALVTAWFYSWTSCTNFSLFWIMIGLLLSIFLSIFACKKNIFRSLSLIYYIIMGVKIILSWGIFGFWYIASRVNIYGGFGISVIVL